MPRLNFPVYKFTINPAVEGRSGVKIFDIVRSKYVALTPEEWVRQHALRFLMEERQFPKGLISVEKEIRLHGLSKRFDFLVYGKDHQPLLLGECKSPDVPISQAVFDQSARYNMTLKVPFFLFSNGLDTLFCYVDHEKGSYRFIAEVPSYEALCRNAY